MGISAAELFLLIFFFIVELGDRNSAGEHVVTETAESETMNKGRLL